MSEYVSIKEEVLHKLDVNIPEIRNRFNIETLSLFGSVARGEDTPASDIDLAYTPLQAVLAVSFSLLILSNIWNFF